MKWKLEHYSLFLQLKLYVDIVKKSVEVYKWKPWTSARTNGFLSLTHHHHHHHRFQKVIPSITHSNILRPKININNFEPCNNTYQKVVLLLSHDVAFYGIFWIFGAWEAVLSFVARLVIRSFLTIYILSVWRIAIPS